MIRKTGSAQKETARKKNIGRILRREWPFHLMLLPGIVFVIIFSYIPMGGIAMAFQNFNPYKGISGSPWVGLEQYEYLFSLPETPQIIYNTIYIAILKILMNLIVPIVVALLLNELRSKTFVRLSQTIVYLPNFISWVILAGVFIDILSPSSGIVNQLLNRLGIESIFFLGDKSWFPSTMVITDVWKSFGYGTIVYLAAITGIDQELYEAATMDGAGRWRQTWNVTLPGMLPIIVLMATLSLGNVLNAGFDQIYNLVSPAVYETGEILDTLIYRIGMINQQYSLSTAVSTLKSFVSFLLISLSYLLASKFAGYRIF